MPLATDKRTLLWYGPAEVPSNVSAAIEARYDVVRCPNPQGLSENLRDADVVLVWADGDSPGSLRRLALVLDQVDLSGAVAVVLLPADFAHAPLLARRRGQFVTARADAVPDELALRIAAAASLQPVIRQLQADVAAVRTLPGAHRVEQLEEEMRLAARLQRDFLPRTLPAVKPVRFACLFRPAGWVSGDMYDVLRLDETHVGFYVADVVGHGLPAALLTIFIKKALPTKRIAGNAYEIISPEAALAQLNADLCQQQLGSCQFCTAAYAVVDAASLSLRYARAGHPRPLCLRADGAIEVLDSRGPLLGIFPEETFQVREVALRAGDRVVMYSDGAEEALASPDEPVEEGLRSELLRLRRLPAEEVALQLTARIDQLERSDRRDDVTVLIMDVETS